MGRLWSHLSTDAAVRLAQQWVVAAFEERFGEAGPPVREAVAAMRQPSRLKAWHHAVLVVGERHEAEEAMGAEAGPAGRAQPPGRAGDVRATTPDRVPAVGDAPAAPVTTDAAAPVTGHPGHLAMEASGRTGEGRADEGLGGCGLLRDLLDSAVEEGVVDVAREFILDAFAARFGAPPDSVVERVLSEGDVGCLTACHFAVLEASSRHAAQVGLAIDDDAPQDAVPAPGAGCFTLCIRRAGRCSWAAQPLPEPGPHEVVVRSLWAAIDLSADAVRRAQVALGGAVEACGPALGEVVACGEGVRDRRVGDRVLCLWAEGTHTCVAADEVFRSAARVAPEQALLTPCAYQVHQGVGRVLLDDPDGRVLVIGGGSAGCLAARDLRKRGFRGGVDVAEPRPERRARALRFGADRAVEPWTVAHLAETSGPYDVAFECSGRAEGFDLAQSALRPRGWVICVAWPSETLCLSPYFAARSLSVAAPSHGDWAGAEAFFADELSGGGALGRRAEEFFDGRLPADAIAAVAARILAREQPPGRFVIEYA